MEVIGFLAGGAFGAAQYLLARRVFIAGAGARLGALYIAQLLILSFGLLVLVFFLWKAALLATAIGLVATSMAMAVIFALKR